eukprot:CAMPEP_0177605008 /NCGR_PEP_ID=MMETSP0419_2-20121207/16448_1 /TAXON_ID=582737 /ORGANISM="Tetraselmis sp., Strain GSL018" /LENGTH=461 /DNA_ID=CAMNT_0019099081 /DNA_START=169 /DNA_END=1554 /DNA_ORIENTATION=+
MDFHDRVKLEEADYVRWEVPDLNGVSKSKIMTKASASKNLIGGISLYGGVLAYGVNSALIVVPEVGDNGHPDCYAVPRPREFGVCGTLPAVVPISYAGAGKNKVVSVICDTRWKHGGSENWQGANPRSIARKQLRELASLGLVMRSSFEYEFRVFNRETLSPVVSGADIFNTLVAAEFEDLMFEIEQSMREMGVGIETLQAEFGSSQLELTLEPQQGLDAADAAFRYKHCVKELTQRRGLLASFMTKPIPGESANGAHFNHSLQPLDSDSGTIFSSGTLEDPLAEGTFRIGDDGGLNVIARHWLGGLLKHAPALSAVCAPTANCYRRLHQPWAPSRAGWGEENRDRMVRVKREGASGCYFENRLACGASNPYLVLAATVAAGIDGLRHRIEPPPAEAGAELPRSLPEAIAALRSDEVVAEAMGEEFLAWFGALKEAEMTAVAAETEDLRLEREKEVYMRFL